MYVHSRSCQVLFSSTLSVQSCLISCCFYLHSGFGFRNTPQEHSTRLRHQSTPSLIITLPAIL
ncbi:hypothetical protein NEOLEDRAFT_461517 [Neolentinus lepideus HHB14362 ss-1]|uniref:Uncharacterized protein n=1 Tax=Neolentinus lepideus HHB14362 ss-1 TaxID=1314782 RepID=A0A165VGR5_9AGAM|nr:hypothetical protein NEOLEDRAFT_461517 [Neolentinus lepideus HHB14362 ss-1]